jgi:hypothetical protein
MRTPLNIINEVRINNNELMNVLIQLGYQDKSTEKKYRFVNDKYNSIVDLPLLPLDEAVRKVDLAIYSYQLYMQGVIREEENLIKKVLQNRSKRKKSLSE